MSNEFVEKDSKIGYVIIIVILVLAVLGLGGFIVYDKFIKEEETVIEDVEEEVEPVELAASHVEDLIEKVEVYNRFLYQYYLVDENEELSNDDALYFVYRVLLTENKDITAENVSNTLTDYFGENKFKLDDIVCDIDNETLYEYMSDTNIYVEKEHSGHGGGRIVLSNIRYVSSRVVGDKVTLITRNLYERSCSDVCGPLNAYYGNVDDMFNSENPVLGDQNSEEEIVLTSELFDSIESKVAKTTYNFIKEESGNYYLDSVSVEK